MVHVGQHMNVRKMLIFDVGWLYEKTAARIFAAVWVPYHLRCILKV